MASAALQPAPAPAPPTPIEWRPATRVAFRFAFCYLGLYSLLVINNVEDSFPYERLWHSIVPWVGRHVLHLSQPITYFPSGSGDKTSDWVLLLCHLVISVVATTIWSIFDRRKEYTRLNEWLRVALRYSAAWTMVLYGSVKVVKLQFPDPSLGRLLEPLGSFSPMGLLWIFMGYSIPYNFFAGCCELLGILLFFRRTATLGSLLTAAVMANVAMLNYAYDTPVKLLSTHIILMCAYLAIPDLRALFDFFVRNKPAAPAPVKSLFTGRRMRLAAGIAKTLFLVYVLGGSAIGMRQGFQQYGSGAPKSPLYGIWDVEEFTRDGATVPPLLTDKERWRRMITQRPNGMTIQGMDDSQRFFAVRFDVAKSKIWSDKAQTELSLAWSRPDAGHLTLTGDVLGHLLTVRLKRMDETKTNLLGRGFHWVSEMPFNK